MRLYYASDIHGSERLWRKFLNTPSFYDVEVLIMGGDLTGKVLVPLVEVKPGRFTARFLGREQKAKGEDKAAELERRIRLNGHYPLRVSPEEMERLQQDEQHRDEVFREVMRAELARWLDRADFPSTGPVLVEAARDHRAPEVVVAELERLPQGETFERIGDVVRALGYPTE
jgi:Icc-related predicted phosphoesterase